MNRIIHMPLRRPIAKPAPEHAPEELHTSPLPWRLDAYIPDGIGRPMPLIRDADGECVLAWSAEYPLGEDDAKLIVESVNVRGALASFIKR